MYTIRKKFSFEMAHVLTNCYSQECRNIHGHSYKLEIIIQAEELNSQGMIMDFKMLSEIVKKHIINHLDHALMIENDLMGADDWKILKRLFDKTHKKVLSVYYNPTAENMAKDIHDKIWKLIIDQMGGRFYSMEVRLHETETGWASYKK